MTLRPAQKPLIREEKYEIDGIRKEVVAVEMGAIAIRPYSKSAVIRYSSRWNGVDAIESISICMSSAEDEETTFLAANSDSWALETRFNN